ncbi:EamA-like transporter family protein [compost metagenome]
MTAARTLLLTALAMLAFAGNSLLCRVALKETAIDAVTFTGIRLASGALMLWLLLRLRREPLAATGNWRAAAALFVYAAAFSYAYLQLDAGTGALLLFGAVQLCMVVFGLLRGERLNPQQALGFALATGGLVVLLLPGASAPPLVGGLLMLLSGLAWGAYTLLGRQAGVPLAATAGNFIRALPFAALLLLPFLDQLRWDLPGLAYAVVSGALTSGVGYAIWYSALPGLGALQAASVQLSVPVLAALGGALLLGEAISLRLALVSLAVLGGIALVLRAKFQAVPQNA